MLTIEQLEEQLYENSPHGRRPSSRRIASKSNQALIAQLVEETNSLPESATVLERLYAFKNGIITRPGCQACSGQLHPSSLTRFDVKRGYSRFCSQACSKGHPSTKAKLAETCLKKYGETSPFKAAVVKDKIKSSNIERFGVESTLQAAHVRQAREAALKSYHADVARQRLAALKRIGTRSYPGYEVEVIEQLFIDSLMMRFTHSCGHSFDSRLLNGSQPRCPRCDPARTNVTAPHRALRDLIVPLTEVVENSRSYLKPSRKEIDIYLPEFKLGIEINGLYWHSFLAQERALVQLTKRYHLEKTELAEANDIKLIHIWEHEATDPRMHDLILSKLGRTAKIGARQLTAQAIEHDVAKQFVSVNHLQGHVNSSTQLGLVDSAGELLAVMTFGKPRFNKDVEWELLRFCSKIGVTVVGGASKLLAKFVREQKPKSILSYAERRLGAGSVYLKLGFKLERQTPPGYFYWKNNETSVCIVSRYMAQKHKLAKLLGSSFNHELSEQDNMLCAGYGLTYDCGQHVFVKHYA